MEQPSTTQAAAPPGLPPLAVCMGRSFGTKFACAPQVPTPAMPQHFLSCYGRMQSL